MEQNRTKQIAKNTFFMYIRMVIMMLVNLYTVRVILRNLGVEDYGIYNLIGGIVVLFSFIGNSSNAATQRFLNFALGEENKKNVTQVFSASIIIHFIVAVVFLVLSEIVGLLCLKYYLNIPMSRKIAAGWVFQLSLITTAIGLVGIPYNAAIVAYEKFSFYAFKSVFDGVCKLCIAFVIPIFSYDKLIFYAFLILVVSFAGFIIGKVYVNLRLQNCHFEHVNDKQTYRELLSFSSWSLLSSVGSTCTNQVLNMILNRFFGVVANAAMGIANQVNNAVYQLIGNFQSAFEPQITKSYASNDNDYLLKLIFKSSKFSFFLLWFFVLPLGLNADFVLKIWLVDVPEYSVIFLRFFLIYSLIEAIIGPLWMVAYSIGNIKNYQIVSFFLSLLVVPLAWVLCKFGAPPYWLIILRVINNITFSSWRLGYLHKRMNFPVINYLKRVIIHIILVVIVSSIVSLIAYIYTGGIIRFIISCLISVIINIISVLFIGCDKNERVWIMQVLKKPFKLNKKSCL